VDTACLTALARARDLLTDLGHEVVEQTPPWIVPDLFDTFLTIWQVGPALHPVEDPAMLTALNRELAVSARECSAVDYVRAVNRLQTLARGIVSFWDQVDVVVTPTLAMPPVPIGWQDAVDGAVEQLYRNTAFTPFTAIANVTGLPAVSVPLHWSDDGLPVGVQAIGPPLGEATLFRLSAQLEQAAPWIDRRPLLS
jgi:amidase